MAIQTHVHSDWNYLMNIFAESRRPSELLHYWSKWRELVGRPCKTLFEEYVILSNEAATLNGFQSCDEMWNDDFHHDNNTLFKGRMAYLWRQIKPLYVELYSYVRYRLRQFYGSIIPEKLPIPAHLFGDLWTKSWTNIYNITVPYPEKEKFDVTEEMVKQGYTPLKIFKTAEKFYKSIGFKLLPRNFWKTSIFEKLDDREMDCHASAWDFSDGKDFRIKMCARVNFEDFCKVHEELGHVHYSIQYKENPHSLRRGANPAFREAVGDAIRLSVTTPKHLRKIGLLKDEGEDNDMEADINYLFKIALEKIAFLPYAYIMDVYRWSIFRGETNPMIYNFDWWKLRREYQGVCPPRQRTENDFDAAANYHTISDTSYIRYFISTILQFQFHKTLCSHRPREYDITKPMKNPLYKCDIFNSKKAGIDLRKMMEMGASMTWQDTMKAFTGRRRVDTAALLEYFAPLYGWLREHNIKNNVTRGWVLHANMSPH